MIEDFRQAVFHGPLSPGSAAEARGENAWIKFVLGSHVKTGVTITVVGFLIVAGLIVVGFLGVLAAFVISTF